MSEFDWGGPRHISWTYDNAKDEWKWLRDSRGWTTDLPELIKDFDETTCERFFLWMVNECAPGQDELIDMFQPTLATIYHLLESPERESNCKWLEELLRRCQDEVPCIPFRIQFRSGILEVLLGFGCVDVQREIEFTARCGRFWVYPIEALVIDCVIYKEFLSELDTTMDTIQMLWKHGSSKPRMSVIKRVIQEEVEYRTRNLPPDFVFWHPDCVGLQFLTWETMLERTLRYIPFVEFQCANTTRGK